MSPKNHLTLIRSERKELVITSKGIMLVRHTFEVHGKAIYHVFYSTFTY